MSWKTFLFTALAGAAGMAMWALLIGPWVTKVRAKNTNSGA